MFLLVTMPLWGWRKRLAGNDSALFEGCQCRKLEEIQQQNYLGDVAGLKCFDIWILCIDFPHHLAFHISYEKQWETHKNDLAMKKYSCGFKIQRQLQTRKLRKVLTMIAVICSCQDVTITTICQQSHKAILKVTKVRRSTYNLAPIKDILQKKSGFWWWPLRWQFWPLPAKRMSGALSGTLEKLCSAQVCGRILKMPKSSTTMPMCWGMLLPKQSILGECIFYLIGYHRIS